VSFFNELKRRNVIRLAIAYVAISWLLIQVVETLFPIYGFFHFFCRPKEFFAHTGSVNWQRPKHYCSKP
jgi:hypothetical protein